MKIWHLTSSKCRKRPEFCLLCQNGREKGHCETSVHIRLGQRETDTDLCSLMIRSPISHLKSPSPTYSWNFGKLPRIRAEQLLVDELVGTFLIRESEHYPGDLTLSIKDDAKIQHYRVKLDPLRHTYTVDDELFFPDLHLLVEVSIHRLLIRGSH